MADKYANQAVIQCTESGTATLTFKKLETGISLFEKVAWLISHACYFISGMSQLNSSGDAISMALTTTDQLTSLALTNAAVIDYQYVLRMDIGTAASGWYYQMPIVANLSGLAGGGVLVPPNPFYLGVAGSGTAAAVTVTCKIYYTTVELKPDEYWELVESRRIISST